MTNLVVGDADCSFNEVMKALQRCETFIAVETQWHKLATTLDVSLENQTRIRRQFLDEGPFSLMQQIIFAWRAAKNRQATLAVLIESLDALDLRGLADSLRSQFGSRMGNGPAPPAPVGESVAQSNPSVRISVARKQNHILSRMDELITLTNCNAQLKAKLLANGILHRTEIEEIEAERIRGDQNTKLYLIIPDKLVGMPDAYDQLIEIMIQLRQNGVSSVLGEVYLP